MSVQKSMCMYKIHYEIEEEGRQLKHSRFYRAKNKATAREMLDETWRDGSLMGYERPKVLSITECNILPAVHERIKDEEASGLKS